MKTEFSFNYGEKQYTFSVNNGEVYELENGITVTTVVKEYRAYNALEWVLYFENKSGKDSQIFSGINDCDTLLPLEYSNVPKAGYKTDSGDACIITMNGTIEKNSLYWENDKESATEFNFNYEYLDKTTTKRFANAGGRSSQGTMPFFDATADGNGYIVAVGWTGDWKTEFSKQESGIHIKSGLKETNFYLKSGEKIRTSSTLIMSYTKTEDKHNKFRKLIKNHFSHKSNTNTSRESLMAWELWGGLTSEEMKKRINEFKEYDVKFEDVWIDAGWYGKCTKCDEAFSGDWAVCAGDWEVNTRVHPQGFKDVAECAKEAGMRLMLWFEPERAMPGVKMVQMHPEWFLKSPEEEAVILNYGNKEALEYVYNLLSTYVEELELSCYRQDFNIRLTSFFKASDEENRRGITEIKHITGMYELWDRLLEKHPELLIDNCASGGCRFDIETLKRSIAFFRSDYQCNFNENPEVLQVHNANISCYLPYNGCTSKTKNDTYAIRSSYSASWGGAFYNAIFQSMNDGDFKWAKKATDEYRKIRKYFSKEFYNHGSKVFDDTSWAIWQYHDDETQSGIVMAFRRSESPFDQVNIKLKGLDKTKTYIYQNFDSGLLTEGSQTLTIGLPEKRSSAIFEYKLK